MRLIANIPNLLTLLNLLLGSLAIVFVLQNGIILVPDDEVLAGYRLDLQAEKVFIGSLLIGLAAVADFLDGWLARLLGATGDMGKQLDSLADVVSFGVAPATMVYQLLRLAFAAEEGGLEVSMLWLAPVFFIPCAAAWRLARFNLDTTTPSHYFRGTPVPAVGLALATLPLIWWHATQSWEFALLGSKWFYYAIIATTCYLMVSDIPLLSNKPKGKGAAAWLPYLLVAAICGLTALLLGWWAGPVTFAAYVLVSVVFKKQIV